MSNRATIILAIGMLLLGLALGAVGGGVMGFFAGRDSARAANPILQGLRQPIQPGQQPGVPPGGVPQNLFTAARITQIEKDSQAEKAGLKQGDVITAIGDTKLDATRTLA
ncbi:MAG: PDZ domain-containing protein, partial [Chloroflexi bacterium]|nr:PDZ domain-containing protein [Chloroflexota bacterium]